MSHVLTGRARGDTGDRLAPLECTVYSVRARTVKTPTSTGTISGDSRSRNVAEDRPPEQVHRGDNLRFRQHIEIAISDGMAQLDTGNWSVPSVQSGVVDLGRLRLQTR